MPDLVLLREVDLGLKLVVDFLVIVLCPSEASAEDIVLSRLVVRSLGVEAILSRLGSWHGNSLG
jgi:hypothetical protein